MSKRSNFKINNDKKSLCFYDLLNLAEKVVFGHFVSPSYAATQIRPSIQLPFKPVFVSCVLRPGIAVIVLNLKSMPIKRGTVVPFWLGLLQCLKSAPKQHKIVKLCSAYDIKILWTTRERLYGYHVNIMRRYIDIYV